MNLDNQNNKQLKARIAAFIKKEILRELVQGLLNIIVMLAVLVLLITASEAVFHFSSPVRSVIAVIFLLLCFAATPTFFYRPLKKLIRMNSRPGILAASARIGSAFPKINDRLLNILQLSVEKSSEVSDDLIAAAIDSFYKKTEKTDFASAVSFAKVRKYFLITVPVVIGVAVMLAFIPSLNAASLRLINFNKEFTPPKKFIFNIRPGNAKAIKGEDVLLTARISRNKTALVYARKPAIVYVALKFREETEYSYKKISRDSTGLYEFEAAGVRSSFTYFFKADDEVSEEFSISVVDRPVIRSMEVSVIPPSYSRLPPQLLKDNGNVTSLKGSQVKFSISATKMLKSAKLLFTDSTTVNLAVSGSNASGSFRMMKDAGYKIALSDKEGNESIDPVPYNIQTVPDESPAIEVFAPKQSSLLGLDDRLQCQVKITDDFGFSALKIYYSVVPASADLKSDRSFAQKPESIAMKEISVPLMKTGKSEDVNYVWNLKSLGLRGGDGVSFYFEVYDNNFVTGPGSAKSGMFTVRMPSLDELFKEADKAQEKAEKSLTETLKETRELDENLEKIHRDMKLNKKDISWQEKEKLEKASEKFSELKNQTEETAKQVNELKNDLQQNNLLSKETLEKYLELQDLFKQMTSEEMQKTIDKMNEAIQSMNRQKADEALQTMKFDEETFKKNVERTLNLLKRIQIEQKMDEMVKRAEDINKSQEDVKNNTSSSNMDNKQQKESLAQKQKEISEDLKRLEEEMKEMQQKMSEFKDMPNAQMEKMTQEFQEQQNTELSKNAEQEIKQGQKQPAMQAQMKMQRNMQKMKQQMSGMQQGMQKQNKMDAFNEMRKTLDNIITMSKEQERLKEQTRAASQQQLSESAKKQSNLRSSLSKIMNQMAELGKKSFAISPEMSAAMGNAQNAMREAQDAIQNKNGSYGSQKQGESMAALNSIAGMMKNSMEQMMDAKSGSGGQASMMMQMQQMSQQQMQINEMTQKLMQGQGLSQQEMQQMQRLAQQQEILRKSIEQLNRENQMSGQSKKMPANLENIAKEMQEAVSEMSSLNPGDNLIKKQEKILSRMLDAQRSINDRDFEKQRESKAGQIVNQSAPKDLNLQPQKEADRIKAEIDRAVKEGYTKDYENLIRRYFEVIGQKK